MFSRPGPGVQTYGAAAWKARRRRVLASSRWDAWYATQVTQKNMRCTPTCVTTRAATKKGRPMQIALGRFLCACCLGHAPPDEGKLKSAGVRVIERFPARQRRGDQRRLGLERMLIDTEKHGF